MLTYFSTAAAILLILWLVFACFMLGIVLPIYLIGTYVFKVDWQAKVDDTYTWGGM